MRLLHNISKKVCFLTRPRDDAAFRDKSNFSSRILSTTRFVMLPVYWRAKIGEKSKFFRGSQSWLPTQIDKSSKLYGQLNLT